MFCESWRETLSAAAVSGEVLPREAQAHLTACSSCRAALAMEQQLFALMDSGLRSMVGVEAPVSLVPRVRAQIAEAPPGRTWRIPALAFAIAALALIALMAFSVVHVSPTKRQSATASLAAPSDGAPREIRPSAPDGLAPIQPAKTRVPIQVKKGSAPIPKAMGQPGLDIIVSADEQASLQRYLSAFRARARNSAAFMTVKTEPSAEIKPLEISEIEMPQLNIEQLQAGESK